MAHAATPVTLVALGLSLGASAALAEGPRRSDPWLDYALQCQGCHLADGSGSPRAGVPRLVGVGRFLGVEGGRAYLVQVPGVGQAPLDDEAIAALLNWVLVRFSADQLPDPFVPYTGGEVREYRSAAPIDVLAVRADLVSRLEGPRTAREAEAPGAGLTPDDDRGIKAQQNRVRVPTTGEKGRP
jgi:mono/diheme cytochrome c family protein